MHEYKEKLVREIFIETGDEDYVMARWLYINDWPRQFFWSAAQALEKYLKAVLLINECSVQEYGHNLVKLFADVKRYDDGVIPDVLEAPWQVKEFSDVTYGDLWGDASTEKFVSRVCENGHSSNRYDYFGIEQDFGDLYKLDQVVFALRNVLDDRIGIVNFKVPTSIFGDSVFWSIIHENNFPFAPKGFKHKNIGPKDAKTVTSLKFLFMNEIADSVALRSWVEDNIHISKKWDIPRLSKK